MLMWRQRMTLVHVQISCVEMLREKERGGGCEREYIYSTN
jgi:hypothetical protein